MGKYAAIAGLAAANMYSGYKSTRAGAKYYRPQKVFIGSRMDEQDDQIATLRRMITLNKQQVSGYDDGTSLTVPASTTNGITQYNLTTRFTGSTDYPKTVLGDRFVNKSLWFRYRCDAAGLDRLRVVVYWARKAGNTWNPTGFQDIPDPSAFIVLMDKMHFPTGNPTATVSNTYKIALKNRQTVWNYSSSVLESGSLNLLFFYDNTAAASKGINWATRLNFANK